jgi:hypothetical protein
MKYEARFGKNWITLHLGKNIVWELSIFDTVNWKHPIHTKCFDSQRVSSVFNYTYDQKTGCSVCGELLDRKYFVMWKFARLNK